MIVRNAAIRAVQTEGSNIGSTLETVFLRCVVVDPDGVDGANGRQERISSVGCRFPLEGLARRDHVVSGTVSTRQREGVAEEQRDGVNRKRLVPCCRRRRAASMEVLAPSRGKGDEPAMLRVATDGSGCVAQSM